MDTLTIDRGQWLTGNAAKVLDDGGTLCHRGTGLMCCLGFYGRACGRSAEAMVGGGTLTGKFGQRNLPSMAAFLTLPLDSSDKARFKAVDVEDALATVNDKQGTHQIRREAAIAYLFKKYGFIDVKFVGKYAEATKKARTYGKKDAD